MGISLDEYKKNRTILINQIDEYTEILSEMKLEDEYEKMTNYKREVLTNNFQLVVVGEFSRGKSTFINALLGEKILPSSAKPTTTILNKIVYNADSLIKLHFHYEKSPAQIITDSDFASLIAPMDPVQGDSFSEKEYETRVDYLKTIQYAEIGRDLEICKSGVEIIDTPGTNDLDPVREQITNTIIPKSDAAILLLSAVKILSESELSLLRDRLLANDIQKIFIVVNFKDALESKEDEEKVRTFAYEHLKDILNDPRIYMVSAKQALNARRKEKGEQVKSPRGRPITVWDFEETGFMELEKSLEEFLQYERGAIKLLKPLQRLSMSINELNNKHIAFEKKVLNAKVVNLKEKVKNFRPKVKQAEKSGAETLKKISREIKKEEDSFIEWYRRELQKITETAMETFDQFRHIEIHEISSRIEAAIAPLEKAIFESKKTKIMDIAINSVKRGTKDFSEQWGILEDDLLNLTEPTDDESLYPKIYKEKSNQPSIFDEIYDELGQAWTNSNSLLGQVGIGIGYVANTLAYGITSLFKWGLSIWTGDDEKSRFRADLSNQFNLSNKQKAISAKVEYESISLGIQKKYKAIVKQQVKQVELQLEQLLKTTGLEENEIKKRLEIIKRREYRLRDISSTLESLNDKVNQQSKGKVGVS
ncbi:dynamin family protein [Planococcus massiliensis]|nr:dynamin family protein [Planococcus massiliensis]